MNGHPATIYLSLLGGTVCAAVGQVLFKTGASGRESLVAFANGWIVAGLVAYGVSTLIWIWALSRAPLSLVYPFTALTFVMVYMSGVLWFQEPTSLQAMLGICLVLAGLYLITTA